MGKRFFVLILILIYTHLYSQKPIILKWQEKPVIDVEYNNDGTILATLCTDKTISLWNTMNYKIIRKLDDSDIEKFEFWIKTILYFSNADYRNGLL